MAAKTKRVHESFEDINDNGKFAKICQGMMKGKAWQELTLQQRGLYLLLKDKFTKYKIGDKKDNRDDISFPKSEWSNHYNTYAAYSRDIDALIERGLIRVVLWQANMRKATIYGFSDKWKLYGLSTFKLDKKELRPKNTLTKEHKEALSKKATETNKARHNP